MFVLTESAEDCPSFRRLAWSKGKWIYLFELQYLTVLLVKRAKKTMHILNFCKLGEANLEGIPLWVAR